MSDDTGTENPLEAIRERADQLELSGDERDDFIERRMQRAGFKRGPGEWISLDNDDDDEENDDDDTPMTRGDYRRIQKENRRKSVATPPKKEATQQPVKKRDKPNAWW